MKIDHTPFAKYSIILQAHNFDNKPKANWSFDYNGRVGQLEYVAGTQLFATKEDAQASGEYQLESMVYEADDKDTFDWFKDISEDNFIFDIEDLKQTKPLRDIIKYKIIQHEKRYITAYNHTEQEEREDAERQEYRDMTGQNS
jgi:hypothetical protein